jgi:hypothetical protein
MVINLYLWRPGGHERSKHKNLVHVPIDRWNIALSLMVAVALFGLVIALATLGEWTEVP